MNNHETLGISEVATLLHAENDTVMIYARSGKLPGTRIGRSWVFLRDDVLNFLRQQIATDTEERRRTSEQPKAVAIEGARRRRPVPALPSLGDAAITPLPKVRG